jgi:hypothetical protein
LLNDAWSGAIDVAVVVSNDTDLCEPIRMVNEQLNKFVGVMCPAQSCSLPLQRVAKFVKHIRHGHLAASQFPNPLGMLQKPATW